MSKAFRKLSITWEAIPVCLDICELNLPYVEARELSFVPRRDAWGERWQAPIDAHPPEPFPSEYGQMFTGWTVCMVLYADFSKDDLIRGYIQDGRKDGSPTC